MSEPVVIPERFRGPPDSANGGYACGIVARQLEGPAEVTLRRPPPLEKPLEVRVEGGSASLLDGEEIVAQGRSAELELTVPDPVSLPEAELAAERYAFYDDHPFAGCFVCGPERDAGDGLRIFPGRVDDRELVAAPWTPDASVAYGEGTVPSEIVWAALDCPTSFGGILRGPRPTSVLGRLTGRLLGPIELERPHVVTAWPLGSDGRKWEGGSAIFTDAGELKGYARGIWIELKT